MRRTSRLLALTTLVLFVVIPVSTLAAGAPEAGAQAIPTPEEFAGFRMGTDKKLVRWDKIVEYFALVARASERVEVRELGKSTLGNPFILATISAPANLARQEEFKAIQRRLAHPYDLAEAEARELVGRGKAVVFIQLNLHSTEIGASQMALELVHRLATEDSPFIQNILDNVIFLLLPSANPDGQAMVVDWYNQNVGSEHEFSRMPWLYHHYVGHDNNRDAFMLTQIESQLITRVLYEEWFPQVFIDEHQMGSSGARIFVPPFMNPINPNVDPIIWAELGWLGFVLNTALNEKGYSGVIYDDRYTAWWQGGFRAAGWWHNIVGLLTEVASARIASPVEQGKTELWKQLPPLEEDFRRRQARDPRQPLPAPRDTVPRFNYPRPWLGGTWRLRDIVDYELTATYALLDACANGRVRLMENHYRMGRRAIAAGKKGNPYAWVFPPEQHDAATLVKLLKTLRLGGVEVHRAEKAFQADGKDYPAGSSVILMAQPYRAYAKDLLERQKHPDPKRYEAGRIRPRPYDVTGWTLRLQMGVKAIRIDKPFAAELARLDTIPAAPGQLARAGRGRVYGYLIRPEPNNKVIATNRLLKAGAEVYWLTEEVEEPPAAGAAGLSGGGGRSYAAGALLVRGRGRGEQVERLVEELALSAHELARAPAQRALRLRTPRIGLYQPWTASMDEGWTRWLLEQYEFDYTTLHNKDMQAGKLSEKFDVIIFPDMRYRQILRGQQGEWVRPEYRGGIGTAGVAAVREFVRAGGTLVLLGDSAGLALETMAVPLKNALTGVKPSEFSCPGSLLRLLVDTRHPVAYGMPAEATASFVSSPAFDLAPSFSYTDLRVIARYPTTNPLQSGWLRGPEHLQDRIAAAEVSYEKGRVVLIGFRAQFRAQAHNTFKLLFNALHYAAAEPAALPRR
ncbi:MAG: M14 family zinc carboxypeptidase [Terriglobia bacterium]